MQIRFFDTAQSFRERVLPFLVKREAENNLILGITTRLLGGQIPGQSLMASVEDNGVVVGACLKTPLRGLVLTRMPEGVAPALANAIREKVATLPNVDGPTESAREFASAWAALSGGAAQLHARLRAYELDRVIPPQPTPGIMIQAGPEDRECVAEWGAAMAEECRMQMPDPKDQMRQSVDRGEVFVWRDERIVAMGIARHGTPNGGRVGMVYTPPEFRRRGYASALVAAVSQRMLDSGCRLCFLFTDLDNPTSNHIYSEIGYRPVCDFENHEFPA